jgi:hypothetical protein
MPLKKPLNPFSRRRVWAPCTKPNGYNLKECVSSLSASFKIISSIIGTPPQGIEIVRVLHAHMDKKKRLEPDE